MKSNSLKNAITLSVACACLFCMSCSSTKSVTINETSSAIEIDGSFAQWDANRSLIDENDTVNYFMSHRDNNLYIYVDIRSPFMQNAMDRSGFILYLAETKKERKNRGIGFPSGSFNLLRENPGLYRTFLDDREWIQKPDNQKMLEELQKDIYDQVMLVEREPEFSGAQYGFVAFERLFADGIEMAVDKTSRIPSLEFKIPINQVNFFQLDPEKRKFWIGFAIEPPQFNIDETYQIQSRTGGFDNRGRGRNQRGNQRQQLNQSLGQYEKWFLIEF